MMNVRRGLFRLKSRQMAQIDTNTLIVRYVFERFVRIHRRIYFLGTDFASEFQGARFDFRHFRPYRRFLSLDDDAITQYTRARIINGFDVAATDLQAIVLTRYDLLNQIIIHVMTGGIAGRRNIYRAIQGVRLKARFIHR